MWLTNSSIGKKVLMSVTGIALILFLTFHACMNVVALISEEGYNAICEFLGANWYAVAATAVLAANSNPHIADCFPAVKPYLAIDSQSLECTPEAVTQMEPQCNEPDDINNGINRAGKGLLDMIYSIGSIESA